VIRIDPTADRRWDAYVAGHPRGAVWYSAAWIDTLARTFGFRPVHLACPDDRNLRGVLPLLLVTSPITGRRLVSLPFSGPAGPLVDSPSGELDLLAAAQAAAAELGCRYLELRCHGDAPEWSGYQVERRHVVTETRLERPVDELWAALRPSVREAIRCSHKAGVTVEQSDDPRHLETFYRLFAETSRKHGLPPQPRSFFDHLWNRMRPGGGLRLFLGRWRGEVINAKIVLTFEREATSLYVGIDYRRLALCPVKRINWECLRWATEAGYERISWGFTPLANSGLRHFKRGFAARERPYDYRYHPRSGAASRLQRFFIDRDRRFGQLACAALGALPKPVLSLAGRLAYRHVA
jgi:hypothetical protein